jgi:hypothetical protein
VCAGCGIIGADARPNRAAAAREPDRGTVAKPTDKLGAHSASGRGPNGCTEALMLAYHFTTDALRELAADGLLTIDTHHDLVGGRQSTVVRMQIIPAGRRQIAGREPFLPREIVETRRVLRKCPRVIRSPLLVDELLVSNHEDVTQSGNSPFSVFTDLARLVEKFQLWTRQA